MQLAYLRKAFGYPLVQMCFCFASLMLLVAPQASHAEGEVNPMYSTSASPFVKYHGEFNLFDTQEEACVDWIAYQTVDLGWKGWIYDRVEKRNENQISCFARDPATGTVAWYSIIAIMRSCDGRAWGNYEMTCKRNVCPANSTGVPEINPTTCTCNDGYAPNPTRISCVPDNLTIKLEGGTTIEPGKSLPFIATVINQNNNQPPTNPVTVNVSLKVDSTSGGHDHGDGTRPRGGIANVGACSSDTTCWSETSPANNGVVVFNFNAPDASGTHTITASCEGCSNTATKSVDVKVENLIPIPESPTLYALTDSTGWVMGAVKNVHTDNHYLTEAAIGKLNKLAKLYTTKVNSKVVLYLNDASLEWGGLFDVDIDNPWATPHTSHDTGTSLDIRAQNSFPIKEGAVPITDFLKFITESKKNHFRAALHCKGSTQTSVCYGKLDNRHFHVDF